MRIFPYSYRKGVSKRKEGNQNWASWPCSQSSPRPLALLSSRDASRFLYILILHLGLFLLLHLHPTQTACAFSRLCSFLEVVSSHPSLNQAPLPCSGLYSCSKEVLRLPWPGGSLVGALSLYTKTFQVQSGGTYRRQLMDISPSLSLPISLKSITIPSGEG